MKGRSAIVIGSGVAGMAAAIRLSVQGFAVSVYEKNNYPGGKLSAFKKGDYHFDAGPSLFTQPQNIEEIFRVAGEPIEDYFKYKKVAIACKYFYENGKEITAFTDEEMFANELAEKTGEPAATVKKYLQLSGKLYNNIGSVFLNYSLHKASTWLHPRIFKALGALKFPYLFTTLNKYNSNKFTSPEAKQLFNRYATYNGSNPYKAPAMLSLIPHLEQNEGTFYPEGGMISITKALHKLAVKKGVKFFMNMPAQRIIHVDGKITGIVVNDTNVFADLIISNADVYFTYKNLLGHLPKAKKVIKQERSSSALIFYWGIKTNFPRLQLHNIFFSKNYLQEFEHIFKKRSLYSDPTVYINITSKMEEGHANTGCENWFVMINAPANTNQDWEAIKGAARKNIIAKLSRLLQTDIEPLIETEEVLDPILIEDRTGSYMGSLYGSSSNSKMAAFLRPPNFTRYVKNLYFCGGSVHPGGGIPLCLKSAKIAADLIQNDFKKQAH
ncbi:MAG: 1-hydroxycarotenoid 3,4-desaturase CrtD [Ferruginibacter sp.]